jgi:hypothetical protein
MERSRILIGIRAQSSGKDILRLENILVKRDGLISPKLVLKHGILDTGG